MATWVRVSKSCVNTFVARARGARLSALLMTSAPSVPYGPLKRLAAPIHAPLWDNASPEGRAELREPNTRLVGSVAFFPERYGTDLIKVSLDILNKRPVPPAVFVEHKLVTPTTVEHYYPNDSLMQTAVSTMAAAPARSA